LTWRHGRPSRLLTGARVDFVAPEERDRVIEGTFEVVADGLLTGA
jgi:hypothetical protein